MKVIKMFFFVLVLALSGCGPQTIYLSSQLNDFVTMQTKTNNTEKVTFVFDSKYKDLVVIPVDANGKPKDMESGFYHNEQQALKQMMSEYLENKFSNFGQDGTKITLSLNKFTVSQVETQSAGANTMAALFGGEIPSKLSAKITAVLTVTKPGEEEKSKTIAASGEEDFIMGMGTGTQTSNLHRGKDSREMTFARAINSANNKIIFMANNYLTEIGL